MLCPGGCANPYPPYRANINYLNLKSFTLYRTILIFLGPLFLLLGCALNTVQSNNEIESKVKQLLSEMSLEEKIGQMTQIDFSVIAAELNSENPIDQSKLADAILIYHVGSILNAPQTPNNQAQTVAVWHNVLSSIQAVTGQSRLKVPVIYGIDAIHGATYTKGSVLFPQAINMAATFNSDLSFKEGEITARELRVAGLQWNFSPVMDLGRQPLWPRLWETYGEDVHLATVMGTSYIKGHQGADFSAASKALTCLKHYVGYSFPINGKDRTPAWIGERMLREYFLPTFEAAIKAGSPTIMVNSAEVDGIPGHANYQYLTTILRDELGFKGFTVSDWEDIKRLYTRDKLAANEKEAVKIAVMAGVDMSMVPFDYSFYHLLLELVNAGEVPLARIDEAVARILTVKYQAGLFKPPTPLLPEATNFATELATDTNRQAARESIILAKNDQHILPLKKTANILLAGPNANLLSVMNGGWTLTWQGDNESLYPKDKLTIYKALQNKSLGKVTYLENSVLDKQTAIEASKDVDVIVLCLGEKPYTETVGNIGSLNLDASQIKLANAMLTTGKPVILIMTGGRPRIITEQAELASAVILGFLPGMEGGEAIADILYGDYNPNGKLPISYPRDTNDIVLYDHKPIETYESNAYHPLYAFGHGLSYTSFKTSDLKLAGNTFNMGDTIELSVTVKNTGLMSGKETVLVYLNDVAASVTRPSRQLKAFKKVELAAGQTQTLHFTLSPEDLSFIGVDLKRVIEPGEFKIMVGDEVASFMLKKP